MTTSLQEQPVAIITGAARGIGQACVQWFLSGGYRVALLDVDQPALLKAHAELSRSSLAPKRMLALPCDVASPADVNAAIEKIFMTFGRIDALINNAGVAVFKPLLETSFDEWRQVMSVNLDGAFLCTQACAPVMLKNAKGMGGCGSVVNIASISGLRASALRVAYGTSKAAIIHLTKQQAVELGNMGIRVNAIAPGPVDTDMAKKVHSAAIRSDYADAIPLMRYGTPEEIAQAVGFLCSPAASYVNGQTLAVDGGFDASGIGLPSLRQVD